MGGELRILDEEFERFQGEMLAAAPLETVAACRAGWWRDERGELHLVWRDAILAEGADYIRRGPSGAAVRPSFHAPVIKTCRSQREAFILSHTHPFSGTPGFSGIDDGGEDELIPKVQARVPGVPHGGFVLGTGGGSVRVWAPDATDVIELDLRRVGHVDRHGAAALSAYRRQDLALGPGTAAALGRRHVAIVGTGGLGWQIASALWRHGVGRVTLIDPDRVEETNLSRLLGAERKDIGRAKVDVLAERLRTMRDDGVIDIIAAPFSDGEARSKVAIADVVMGSTDTLGSRLDLDRFSRRLLVPYVDAGINVSLRDGRIDRIGGRVNVSWPLGPCLSCMGVLTPDALAAEAEPTGYRGTARLEEAAVLGFNIVVAGLAVVETLALLIPFRTTPRSSRYLAYDGLRGVTREISVPEAGHCGTCGELAGAVFGTLP
jgi:molybdopterin-synthase adenylyltransferase